MEQFRVGFNWQIALLLTQNTKNYEIFQHFLVLEFLVYKNHERFCDLRRKK